MSKYRIKMHSQGYYTIQKRFLFLFWHEMRLWGDDYVYTSTWSKPPVETLKEFEKYG